MKKLFLAALILASLNASAGFGIQLGALSPNSALKDNDNSLVLGADFSVKFAVIGLKIEGFYVDSSGQYSSQLPDDIAGNFAEANVDVEGMLAADIMFYPLGTTFFLQAGVNYTALDAEDLRNVDGEVIDNELGLDLGLGITVFDKLMVQGKVMFTPDAINGGAAEVLDMDENLFGYLVTAGWRF